jgi:hypothetical protein
VIEREMAAKKVLLTKPETVIAIALRDETERPAQGRTSRKRAAPRAEV